MSAFIALTAISVYIAILVALARYGDARRGKSTPDSLAAIIYAGALAVYATSWTFFGAVGTAATRGWDYLPIYLGPFLVFTLGFGFVRLLVTKAKAEHATSLADFLSARYGKSQMVAVTVTVIAVVASVPYIALQLRSVTMTYTHLIGGGLGVGPAGGSGVGAGGGVDAISSIFVTAGLAAFAMYFGTRRADVVDGNRGLMLAVAFKSAVKLAALMAVALYAVLRLGDMDVSAAPNVWTLDTPLALDRFLVLTLISGAAILLLPRQFHVAVVECEDAKLLTPARWMFAVYLVIVSLAVLPITAAGEAFGVRTSADLYVLALPLQQGQSSLALIAFLGGFAAATGMIVVASVALANMVTNECILPRWDLDSPALAHNALVARRLVICAVMGLAYLYHVGSAEGAALASMGILSFSAIAQFLPAVIGGLVWKGANRKGMMLGLVAGFVLWLGALMIPAYTGTASPLITAAGTITGLDLDPLTWGVGLSLGVNTVLLILGSMITDTQVVDRLQASHFVGRTEARTLDTSLDLSRVRAGDVYELMRRCLGDAASDKALSAFELVSNRRFAASDTASPALVDFVENQISRVTGTASARLLIESAIAGRDVQFEDVVSIIDKTSQRLQFSETLMTATLDHLPQGVSVIDSDMRLVAWNQAYLHLFDYPDGLIYVGRPIRDVIAFNIGRTMPAGADITPEVDKRLQHLKAGRPHVHERIQPGGRILRLEGNPMPGGSYVTSFTDITEARAREAALEDAKKTLEDRVAERTQALALAKTEAERATRSKTRFLAAASHDLLQPLNAARLFTSALKSELQDTAGAASSNSTSALTDKIDRAIASADHLLRSLLDISRLDGGGITAKPEAFALQDILCDLRQDFAIIAAQKGLDLQVDDTSVFLHTDPGLLRSVLQNLLSNAVRYTDRGSVRLRVVDRAEYMSLQIWDTGPGIPEAVRSQVFEEFTRLEGGKSARINDEGAGLGLAISRRIADLLDHRITLLSRDGKGSLFAVRIPRVQIMRPDAVPAPSGEPLAVADSLPSGIVPEAQSLRVLCLDDDPRVLDGYQSLLARWGLRPILAASLDEAQAQLDRAGCADLILIDYHLSDGLTGYEALDYLHASHGPLPPAIMITAERRSDLHNRVDGRVMAVLPKPVAPASLRALIRRVTAPFAAE